MIYNLISSDLIKEVTFISVLFAFILTCAAIALGKNILPRDAGRAYAINGSKSVGKPRGAGIIFILTFTFLRVIYQTGCGNYHLSDFNACGNVKRLLR